MAKVRVPDQPDVVSHVTRPGFMQVCADGQLIGGQRIGLGVLDCIDLVRRTGVPKLDRVSSWLVQGQHGFAESLGGLLGQVVADAGKNCLPT